jgi:hypothetical protein
MHVSRRGISLLLPLVVAVAAIGSSGAQAGSKPDASGELRALHWKHEDALYGARPKASEAQTTAAAQLRALHWKHEDALYRASGLASGSQRSATTDLAVGGGLGWSEALSGAGGAVALIIVGAAATTVIRRRYSRFAQS